ncbi:TonB-dependent receptor [Haliea sp. AH-315-K21]|uniref:TonB-dependent receptor n=1 Tax=SAR86 cluster bacterium TaxID=2030880 RepID=A0A2A5C9R5_9GAMM|nr:TonB-dependent receptor [Haliea sp. AH-315-K21]PCJ40634.1 MAG: TonB-dependent receptor [SAR86 cluster bacterium]
MQQFNPKISTLSLSIALLCGAAQVSAQSNSIDTIIVTADRQETELRDIAASVYAVDSDYLDNIKHVHIGEVLNSIPGVVFNRGNGQESLLGIRAPVLTGAGSCGAVQISQDGIPVRAAGFCNVNQLFEANTEQASRIEVVRGPGSVLYGVNALHGAINIISPTLGEAGGNVSLDFGPHEYGRLNLGYNTVSGEHAFGVNFNGASDGGYKDDSGFGQQKLNFAHRYSGDITVTTVFAATNLNQETAGYLVGADAYKNDALQKVNGNPDAYRDASSIRLHSRIEGEFASGASWMLTPYIRDTDMEFLMHFLPGTPVEENGHSSIGLQTMYSSMLTRDLEWIAGVDFELTDGYLRQTQAGGFGSFPAGRQYDYDVDAQLISPYVQFKFQPSANNQFSLGLRYELLDYDYDNKMIDGNTAEDGSSCTPSAFNPSGTCRYSRPADRSDDFSNSSIQLGWIHDFDSSQQVFVNVAHAFRAPQATELYRLQVNQSVADLNSEEVDSFEIGYRAARDNMSYSVVAYWMEKDNVIFQDSSRSNVSGGETDHTGLEFNALFDLTDSLQLNVVASYANHTYGANIAPRGVTVSIDGNDIDTAPELTGNVQLIWAINASNSAQLEWVHMDEYYTNETNTNSYEGHDLVNLRYQYQSNSDWYFAARITNLFDTEYAERADWTSFVGDRYFVGEPASLYVTIGTEF